MPTGRFTLELSATRSARDNGDSRTGERAALLAETKVDHQADSQPDKEPDPEQVRNGCSLALESPEAPLVQLSTEVTVWRHSFCNSQATEPIDVKVAEAPTVAKAVGGKCHLLAFIR